ncbi:MAG: hypothetical protein K2W81_02180 [Sphingomonas sp.]|uniref:P-II family nitrogen regulator n=1 Tax=Sphingomonas sp. TaxID=28214 RepID=UPI0025F17EF9|nr:hypothetical protein [Sphingomonas sp.]MBY0282756.1 hypothetical protein [Sphingomonas sp.]
MKVEVVQRRRIEVLLDRPLASLVIDATVRAGINGYTLLPVQSGAGHSGTWTDDEISGAQAKVILLSVTSQEKTERFIDDIAPILDSHGLVLFIGIVDVVRGSRF